MATAQAGLWKRHEVFEKNSIILLLGALLVVAIGGLVEITPLFYLKSTVETVEATPPSARTRSPRASAAACAIRKGSRTTSRRVSGTPMRSTARGS